MPSVHKFAVVSATVIGLVTTAMVGFGDDS